LYNIVKGPMESIRDKQDFNKMGLNMLFAAEVAVVA
jgi:hypothetical protein